MTPNRLLEIKERLEKVTLEDWELGGCSGRMIMYKSGGEVADVDTKANADFIAHSKQDIQDLLEEVKRLQSLSYGGFETKCNTLQAENIKLRQENERLQKADQDRREKEAFICIQAGVAFGKTTQQAMMLAAKLQSYPHLKEVKIVVNSVEQSDKIKELRQLLKEAGEALKEADVAIHIALADEDGLDGSYGEKVIKEIRSVLEAVTDHE